MDPSRVERLIIRVAVLDGLVALFILSAAVALVVHPSDIPLLPLASMLVAVALAVAWRGAADVRAILRGDRRWWRPAVEGFITVAALVFLWFMAGALSELAAASTIYQGAATWKARDWMMYIAFAASVAAASGTVGAMLGTIVGSMNRAILRRAAL